MSDGAHFYQGMGSRSRREVLLQFRIGEEVVAQIWKITTPRESGNEHTEYTAKCPKWSFEREYGILSGAIRAIERKYKNAAVAHAPNSGAGGSQQ